jgi:hypothetical protein
LKKGEFIAGVKLLAVGIGRASLGRKISEVRFLCNCGRAHTTITSAVTRAVKDGRNLTCRECMRREKVKYNTEPIARRVALPREQYNHEPCGATRKLLASLNPAIRARAEAIFSEHMAAAIRNNVALEPIDRIWTESVSIAKLQPMPSDERWTAETRSQGLETRCYRQYEGGIAVFG